MEGSTNVSFRACLLDILESSLGAHALEPLRGESSTTRNGKKRRISAKPGPRSGQELQEDLKKLQQHPEGPDVKRTEAESALVTLLVQGCTHAPRTEYLCSLLSPYQQAGLLEWNSFLGFLLAACPAPTPKPLQEINISEPQKSSGPGSAAPSPKSPQEGRVSMRQGPPERFKGGFVAVESRAGHQEVPTLSPEALPAFQPTFCRITKAALDSQSPLKPLTCLKVFRVMLAWIKLLGKLKNDDEEVDDPMLGLDVQERSDDETLRACLQLVRRLTLEDDFRLPSYVLLDETFVLGDTIPINDPLLAFLYDVQKRKDKVVYFFTRTDCQIRSPTFATLRAPPFTLQGILGEPLKGAEMAAAVPPHSREWERAMACLKQGLRNSVSADWWRRVLVLAPQFAQADQTNPIAEFSSSMLTEALVLRTLELLRPYPQSSGEALDGNSWQEWCLFADLLFQIVRSGHVDFPSFIDHLSKQGGPNGPSRSPLLAWLLSQVLRLEAVVDHIKRGTPEEKKRTFNQLVEFGQVTPAELSQAPHVAVLLDWSPSFLLSRLSMYSQAMHIPFPPISAAQQNEHAKRIKEADGWYSSFEKSPTDFYTLDERQMGRLWFLSHLKSQDFCKILVKTFTAQGTYEVTGAKPGDPVLAVLREVKPLPVSFLTGLAIHSLSRTTNAVEELIAAGQPLLSVSMAESYVRMLLVSPQSLYRKLLETLLSKYKPGDERFAGSILTILELLNYRLIPFYRYHNKLRSVWTDLERILAALCTMPGQHRLYRLTENVAMSVLPSIHREYAGFKAGSKGAQTSEMVNRLMILNLAMVSKTRGFAASHDIEHVHTAIKQILAHSTHAWSEKTLKHFPSIVREQVKNREDVRGKTIMSEWQKVGKAAISAHTQLFNHAAADSAVGPYLKNVPKENRRWACVAMWTFMDGKPEKLNLSGFIRALKEFTPEEVSGNVYLLVDFILHSTMTRVQKGEVEATILARISANLAYVLWHADLLPYDVALLALADRDDHPQALALLCLLLERPEILQKVKVYCDKRGASEHWTKDDLPVRAEAQAALGNHYAGKERHPPIFDDLCLRLLPVLPILVGRLVEHERFDAASKLLTSYAPLLAYHNGKLMMVRDMLAYYHGTMPPKLVHNLLTLLDPQKYSFSDQFASYLKNPSNPEPLLSPQYFLNLLTKVAHVLPSMGETLFSRQNLKLAKLGTPSRWGGHFGSSSTPWQLTSVFARHQDCSTQGQLLMMTAEIEILAQPFAVENTVKALVNAVIHPENVGRMEASRDLNTMAPNKAPGGVNSNPLYRPGITPSAAQFAETAGILLAQTPSRFHLPLFEEVHAATAAIPWFNGSFDGLADSNGADKYRFYGWPLAAEANNASEEGTVTSASQMLGMVHAFAYSLPFEWMGSLNSVVQMQRPVRSTAHLRFCFKLIGPMVPAVAPSRPLFAKILALFFTILADVYGRSSQTSAADAMEICDLVDYLHHCMTLEGRSFVPGDRVAHASTLKLCSQAVKRLHPELQKLFRHVTADPERSLFAAELAELAKKPD